MFGMEKTSTSRSIQTSTCEPCKKILQADVNNLDQNEFMPKFVSPFFFTVVRFFV